MNMNNSNTVFWTVEWIGELGPKVNDDQFSNVGEYVKIFGGTVSSGHFDSSELHY